MTLSFLGTPAARVLVLCRTSAQVASLRSRLAARGGAAGVEITTLDSFATEAFPGALPEPVEPEQAPLLERIGARPGLRRLAREHAVSLALHRLGDGEAVTALEDLEPLATPLPAEATAPAWLLARLQERAGAARVGPTAVLSFDEVYALGFDLRGDDEDDFLRRWAPGVSAAPEPVSRWERRALELLRARAVPVASAVAPVPSCEVPDPAAAARLAVRLIADAGEDALVLVPDTSTADRLAAAGSRNGVTLAQIEASSLASHPLVSALRAALPWFEPGQDDPPLRAADLDAVLTHPLVGSHLPQRVINALAHQLTDDQDTRLKHKDARKALRDARINEAPLSRWIERLGQLCEDEDLRLRRRALLLRARLERLRACVGGEPWPDPAEPGDEELASEADLQSDDDDERRSDAAPGTLGALRRFFTDCRLRVWDDPIAHSLLASLLAARDLPASTHSLAEVLDGRARSGRLVPGVDVLRYEDYDGRACDRLVLLGVHDKGLGASGSPDPLLGDEALARIGVLVGRQVRLFRLLQARRAAARSQRPFAIISRTDATGRAVNAPLELDLDAQAGSEFPSRKSGWGLRGFQARGEQFSARSRKSRACAEAYFSTPHKRARRLTPRSRKRAIAGRKLARSWPPAGWTPRSWRATATGWTCRCPSRTHARR